MGLSHREQPLRSEGGIRLAWMIGKTLPSARPVFLFTQDSPQTAAWLRSVTRVSGGETRVPALVRLGTSPRKPPPALN